MSAIESQRIKTFVVSLKRRADRREHISQTFKGKSEFDVSVVDAIEHAIGAIGLWQTIKGIIYTHAGNEELILICEDDHQFTNHYTPTILKEAIQEANRLGADILCGGVSWLNTAFPSSGHLRWMEKFTGTQFIIIFRKFYPDILSARFQETDSADFKISALTDNKYFIYPFISVQREFGYSDVTPRNNLIGRVETLFEQSQDNVFILDSINTNYRSNFEKMINSEIAIDNFFITTFVLAPTEISFNNFVNDNLKEKPEFLPVFVHYDPSHDQHCSFSIEVLKQIVKQAIMNGDDAVAVCNCWAKLTDQYAAHFLFQNILKASSMGADILFGHAADFGLVVPITDSLCWVSYVKATSIFILFSSGYEKILNAPDSYIGGQDILAEFSSNKLLLCPFILDGNNKAEVRLESVIGKYISSQL